MLMPDCLEPLGFSCGQILSQEKSLRSGKKRGHFQAQDANLQADSIRCSPEKNEVPYGFHESSWLVN